MMTLPSNPDLGGGFVLASLNCFRNTLTRSGNADNNHIRSVEGAVLLLKPIVRVLWWEGTVSFGIVGG